MQFLVENEYTTQRSHAGVQEFVAPEGTCYMPYWVRWRRLAWVAGAPLTAHSPCPQLMGHLSLSEGSIVHVRNVTLRKATFVKLQPMTDAFLECSNPRAVYAPSHFTPRARVGGTRDTHPTPLRPRPGWRARCASSAA